MSIQMAIFLLYFAIVLGIGYLGMVYTHSESDYLIAGGNLGWALGGATIAATQMSSGLFIGTIGMMYSVGWSFGWVVLVFPIAYWIMVGVIAPRFTRVKKLSLSDFIATRYYSETARGISAILILISFIVYIQAQIVAGGLIGNIVFGVPKVTGMIVFTVILLIYTVTGGMLAVVYTDFLQMMVMLLGAIVAVPVALQRIGGMAAMFDYVQAANPVALTWKGMPPSLLFTLGLAFFLGAVARPEQLVRFYAMKDMKTIRWGIAFVMVLVGLAHFFVFFLSVASRVLFPALPAGDLAMPMLAQTMLPPFIGTVLLAAVASAMMSTVDSLLLVAGGALSHDIYGSIINRKATEQQKIWVSRIGVIVVGILPVALILSGVGGGDVVQLIVALFSALMGAGFAMPVVLGVLWKRATREAAIASMIGGIGTTFVWKLFGNTKLVDPVVPGFLVAAVLMVAVSLLTPPPPEAALTPFFGSSGSK
ncbi:MAG: sodium/proline symporter [Ignavibacteriales bacterium]